MKNKIKDFLKKIAPINAINRNIKNFQLHRRYVALCNKYATGNILKKEDRTYWARRYSYDPSYVEIGRNYKIFYIGTDKFQDGAGLVDALGRYGELHQFRGPGELMQQLMPTSRSELERCYSENTKALCKELEQFRQMGGIDLIIGQFWGFSFDLNVLQGYRSEGTRVVAIAMDDRHSFELGSYPCCKEGGTKALSGHVDYVATAAPECVEWHRKEGTESFFWPEGGSPELFNGKDEDREFDVVFIGAKYGERSRIIEKLKKCGLKVCARGRGWPEGRVDIQQSASLLKKGKIALGIGGVLHSRELTALKMRDFEAPMAGGLYLTQSNPDLGLVYNIGKEIETWDCEDELVEKALFLAKNDRDRESMAELGKRRAVKMHTWHHRVNEMLKYTK